MKAAAATETKRTFEIIQLQSTNYFCKPSFNWWLKWLWALPSIHCNWLTMQNVVQSMYIYLIWEAVVLNHHIGPKRFLVFRNIMHNQQQHSNFRHYCQKTKLINNQLLLNIMSANSNALFILFRIARLSNLKEDDRMCPSIPDIKLKQLCLGNVHNILKIHHSAIILIYFNLKWNGR